MQELLRGIVLMKDDLWFMAKLMILLMAMGLATK